MRRVSGLQSTVQIMGLIELKRSNESSQDGTTSLLCMPDINLYLDIKIKTIREKMIIYALKKNKE